MLLCGWSPPAGVNAFGAKLDNGAPAGATNGVPLAEILVRAFPAGLGLLEFVAEHISE